MSSAKLQPWTLKINYKDTSSGKLSVYKMCGDKVCGEPVRKIYALCTKIGCPKGIRCNGCSATLANIGNALDDLPQFKDGKLVGRYGLQFDDQTCPFLTFGSDFRTANRAWFKREGWISGCKPRVSCRARGGKRCRGSRPVFDVAVRAAAGYTTYYGRGNAKDIDECIAGVQVGGVPFGEVLGVDCDDRGI